MEFKVCQQQRSELTNSAVSLIKQREIVELFRLSELLRFSYGRFKFGPWQYGLNRGKHIAASGARLDESLAHASIEPSLCSAGGPSSCIFRSVSVMSSTASQTSTLT